MVRFWAAGASALDSNLDRDGSHAFLLKAQDRVGCQQKSLSGKKTHTHTHKQKNVSDFKQLKEK
jgi:hypothetical protein